MSLPPERQLGSQDATPPLPPATAVAGTETNAVDTDDQPKARRSQADKLVELVGASDLFHAPDGEPYAGVRVDGHREVWPLHSRGFALWLRREYYQTYHKVPYAGAFDDARRILEAKAHFDGPEANVAIRVAAQDAALYLDLANADWAAVEVTEHGWQIVAEPPVNFRRTRGMTALPYPVADGTVEELRRFVNAPDESWPLLLAWLVAALTPTGPYPILVLQGEQGAAKSTTARLLQALVDPSTAPLRSPPRDERDLAVMAANAWVLCFDNLSRLPPWLSDALCRLATSSGFRTRQLYTDGDEVIFAGQRPLILNGIEELAERDDLRDRALLVNLPPLTDTDRQDEATLWAAFEAAKARILGALLEAVRVGLRRLPEVKLVSVPRMADFAKWAMAAEPGLGLPSGSFIRAYRGNRESAIAMTTESDTVAQAVIRLADAVDGWRGTATDLLKRLESVASHTDQTTDWPKNGRLLSNRLRRIAPALRAVGLHIAFDLREGDQRRLIQIQKTTPADRTERSEPSEPGPAAASQGTVPGTQESAPAAAASVDRPEGAPGETNDAPTPDAPDARAPAPSKPEDAAEADMRAALRQGA